MTQHPEFWAALSAKFDDQTEVKTRTQAGRQLHYITARTAMNRLDSVLGPENWWDDYVPGESSVICRLTVRLPDGSILTKSDAGGYAGMADQGDDDKSGFSDAFKRAAVKFGVGRYLYRDGVPTFKRVELPAIAAGTNQGDNDHWRPATPSDLRDWLKDQKESFEVDPVKPLMAWARERAYPGKVSAWSPAQVLAGHHEAEAIMARLLKDRHDQESVA